MSLHKSIWPSESQLSQSFETKKLGNTKQGTSRSSWWDVWSDPQKPRIMSQNGSGWKGPQWVTWSKLPAQAGFLEHPTLDCAPRQLSNVSTMLHTNTMESLGTLKDLPRFTFKSYKIQSAPPNMKGNPDLPIDH